MSESLLCNICGKTKPLEEFHWRNQLARVRHRVCSDCQAEASKRHYERNASLYVTRTRERRAETRLLLENYASSTGCVSCGEADPVCLAFDPVSKSASPISTLAASRTWSGIEPQLDQYVVHCLNCQAKARARSS